MQIPHEASAVSWAGTLGEAACSAESGTRNLDVLDWSPADRGLLEEKLRGGPVVVSFTGCELAIVPGCTIGAGRYAWYGYSRKDERIEVRDLDELRARLPLGATHLVGALQHHGGLSASLSLVGLWMLELADEAGAQPTGECAGATHVIVGAHAGAFALGGGAQHTKGSGWRGDDGELAGQRSRHVMVLHGDGDRSKCVGPSPDGPPAGCKAIVRIELAPLPRPRTGSAPAASSPACPTDMVLVEGGSANGQSVPAFCIDRHEVTVAAWDACVGAGDCPGAARVPDLEGGSRRARELAAGLCTTAEHGQLEHPINCVSQAEATAFCMSRGAELPSDPQWVRAATGSRVRRHPWGDDAPDAARTNACGEECSRWFSKALHKSRRSVFDGDDGHVGTAPVGSFPAGDSEAGVADLVGNVAEWTSTMIDGERVAVRGGSFWESVPAALRISDRTATDPSRRDVTIGFRCVAEPRAPE